MKDDLNNPDRWAYRREYARHNYPPGTRIRLIEMPDDPSPVQAGTCGTVLAVDDAGSCLCSGTTAAACLCCPVWTVLSCSSGPGIETPRREAPITKRTPKEKSDEPRF